MMAISDYDYDSIWLWMGDCYFMGIRIFRLIWWWFLCSFGLCSIYICICSISYILWDMDHWVGWGFRWLWQNLLNLVINYSMIELEHEIVRRRNVSSLLKNLPGKIITFSSQNNLLQNSITLGMTTGSKCSIFINIVAYNAPEALPTLQYTSLCNDYYNNYWFLFIIFILLERYS